MTTRTSRRRDAALQALDPLPEQPQEGPDLVLLATAHPRNGADVPVARRRPRRAARRGALALAVALTGLAGGGAALAATGQWDDVRTQWADITGGDPQRQPAAPSLVARGTGTNHVGPVDLQLWVADTADGGRCASIRALGYSLDSCEDGQDPPSAVPLPSLDGEAFFTVSRGLGVDYLYGHADPQQAGEVRLSEPDGRSVSTPVDRVTGYWVTSLAGVGASGDLTLTVLDRVGAVLLTRAVAP